MIHNVNPMLFTVVAIFFGIPIASLLSMLLFKGLKTLIAKQIEDINKEFDELKELLKNKEE